MSQYRIRTLVPRTCQRPESVLLHGSGLFRPLRSPVLHLGKGIGVKVEVSVSR